MEIPIVCSTKRGSKSTLRSTEAGMCTTESLKGAEEICLSRKYPAAKRRLVAEKEMLRLLIVAADSGDLE